MLSKPFVGFYVFKMRTPNNNNKIIIFISVTSLSVCFNSLIVVQFINFSTQRYWHTKRLNSVFLLKGSHSLNSSRFNSKWYTAVLRETAFAVTACYSRHTTQVYWLGPLIGEVPAVLDYDFLPSPKYKSPVPVTQQEGSWQLILSKKKTFFFAPLLFPLMFNSWFAMFFSLPLATLLTSHVANEGLNAFWFRFPCF